MNITVLEYLTSLGLYLVTIETDLNRVQIEAYIDESQLLDNIESGYITNREEIETL